MSSNNGGKCVDVGEGWPQPSVVSEFDERVIKEEPRVLFEDENMMVLSKPSGWICGGSGQVDADLFLTKLPTQSVENLVASNRREHLVHYIMLKYGSRQDFPIADVQAGIGHRWGLAHRLDVDTSGVVMLGKNRLAFEHLRQGFNQHTIHKQYLCLAHGSLKQDHGIIESPIATSANGRFSFVHERKGKRAHTSYQVLARFSFEGEIRSLCRVKIRTGRTHQIRVHMASIGHPLVGDRKYGCQVTHAVSPPRIFLHAERIAFDEMPAAGGLPRSQEVVAALPNDLTSYLMEFVLAQELYTLGLVFDDEVQGEMHSKHHQANPYTPA